jgi:hypothetical protein
MAHAIERKRTSTGIQWYIDGELHGELNQLTFENLTPTFEKLLLYAAKMQHVRLIREEYIGGGVGYVATMTGLMKFVNVL